ncbi:MAG: Uma2 family endonuclease [Phaeodactylibacter sp.]|nr:Uma2 family endonuclease [Phaeodactylibacter sp.]
MASSAETETKVMSPIREIAEFGPLILDKALSREEFIALSSRYPDLRMEREKSGKITIMSPVKGGSGNRESIVIFFLTLWWFNHRKGKTYSSATGFEIPGGAIKSPDCAWVSPGNLAKLTLEEQENDFLGVIPDLVVEVRSKTDRLAKLKKKMKNTWMKNGVRLAWLIDPYEEKAYIYRSSGEVETITGFEGKKLTGEDVMPGMELPLEELRIAEK